MFYQEIMIIAVQRAAVIQAAMQESVNLDVNALRETKTPAQFIKQMPFDAKNGEITIINNKLKLGLRVYLHNANIKMIMPVEAITCAKTRSVVTMMVKDDMFDIDRHRAAIFAAPYLEYTYGRDIWDELNITRGDICSIGSSYPTEVKNELTARLELSAGMFGKELVYTNCSARKPFIECTFTDQNVANFIHLFSAKEYSATDGFTYSIVEASEDGGIYLIELSKARDTSDINVMRFHGDISRRLKDTLLNSKHLNKSFKISHGMLIESSMRKYLNQEF